MSPVPTNEPNKVFSSTSTVGEVFSLDNPRTSSRLADKKKSKEASTACTFVDDSNALKHQMTPSVSGDKVNNTLQFLQYNLLVLIFNVIQ